MAGSVAPSPEFLAERNDPGLDQRVSIVFIIIDTLFLIVFYVSRYYNPKAVGIPMLVCNTLCYLFCLGSAVAGILMTQIGGVGYHVQAVPIETFQTWLKLSKVLEFTYTPAVMFAKLAALFLYHQVFAVHSGYRFVFLAIGIIVALQGIISFILAFSICRPFRYFWTQAVDINDGTCGDVMLFYKSYSIPSLITDLAMLIVPWPILLRLQMPTSEKIGLFFTFLAGSLGIITCALRFSVFFTTPLFSDPTWYASGGPMIYALVEPSIYMIASILPTTRHLYRRLYRQVMQQYGPNSEATPENSDRIDSTELERIESDHKSSSGIRRQVDIWQVHTSPSQEQLTKKDLTPKQWYPRPETPAHDGMDPRRAS